MSQWLYKATDTEIEEGHRRPDFELTRAFAVEDGVICRSPYNRGTTRKAALVWRVEVGDVVHLYHSQWAPTRAVRFVGSFRVLQPAEGARFDPDCALGHVKDPGLVDRLIHAYKIPDGDVITGWLVAPASDAVEPAPEEEQLRWFLRGQSTLATYAPPKRAPAARPRRPKDEVARELMAWHFRVGVELSAIYRFFDEHEDREDEPIKLLEVSALAQETGSVDTFGFDANDDITYPSSVGMVTTHELELIRRGDLELPPGWDLSTAQRFSREDFQPSEVAARGAT